MSEEKFDIRKIMPMLAQFGISSDQLSGEKLNKLMKLTETIKTPSEITPNVAYRVMECLGMSVKGNQIPVKKKGKKIGRNNPCPCGHGKKYKKCCGAK